MDTPPSVFIIKNYDIKNLPNKLLVMFLKNLFRYGLKDVKLIKEETTNNSYACVFLKYSPKNTTVEEKLQGLPVKYLRLNAQSPEEVKYFLTGIQKYNIFSNFFAIEDGRGEGGRESIEQPHPQYPQVEDESNVIIMEQEENLPIANMEEVVAEEEDQRENNLPLRKRKLKYKIRKNLNCAASTSSSIQPQQQQPYLEYMEMYQDEVADEADDYS